MPCLTNEVIKEFAYELAKYFQIEDKECKAYNCKRLTNSILYYYF